jgi:hypothetical protein
MVGYLPEITKRLNRQINHDRKKNIPKENSSFWLTNLICKTICATSGLAAKVNHM